MFASISADTATDIIGALAVASGRLGSVEGAAEGREDHEAAVALLNLGLLAASPPDPDEEPTQVLMASRYEIESSLGRGGMGEVFLARDRRMDRWVALKSSRCSDPAMLARFMREAKLTGRLEHPNIVPVHEVFEEPDGTLCFTMRRVGGHSIAERLAAGDLGGRIERLRVFRKICDAIAFAHAHGVIHRDLKPSNVMLGEFGEVIVLDWGLARELDVDEADGPTPTPTPSDRPAPTKTPTNLTRAGAVMGTPAYMSPEQARGEPLDERTDIYALGVLLRALLTGCEPLQGAANHANDAAVRPLPRELRSVIERALAARQNDRYATVHGLARDVDAYLEGMPVAAAGDGLRLRIRRWHRRHRKVLRATFITAFAALIVLVCFGIYTIGQLRSAEREAELSLAQSERQSAITAADQGHLSKARQLLDAAAAIHRRHGVALTSIDIADAYLASLRPPPLLRWTHPKATPTRPLDLAERGQLLLTADESGIWRVHALPSGKLLAHTQIDPTCAVTHGLIAGERALVACKEPGRIVVSDVTAGGTIVATIEVNDETTRARLARDGLHLVIFGDQGARRFGFDGKPAGPLLPDLRTVTDLNFDATWLIGHTISSDSARTPPAIDLFSSTGQVTTSVAPALPVALSPSGKTLAYTADDSLVVRALDDPQGGEVRSHVPVTKAATITFTADESEVFVWSFDRKLQRFSATDGRLIDDQTLDVSGIPRPPYLAAASSSRSDTIEIYALADTSSAQDNTPLGVATSSTIAASPGGFLLAIAGRDGLVQIRDAASLATITVLRGPHQGIRDLAFAPNGETLIAAGRDGAIHSWPLIGADPRPHTWPADEGIAMSVAFMPDASDRVWVGHESGAIIERSLRDGTELRRVSTPISTIWDLDIAPDGRSIAASGRLESSVEFGLWSTDTGLREPIRADLGATYGLQFSPDSRRLVVANHIGRPALVDLEHHTVERLPDHAGPTMTVAISPDGKLIAVGGYDGRLHLWDAHDLSSLLVIQQHSSQISRLCFSADSTRITTISGDGSIALFDLERHHRIQATLPQQLGESFVLRGPGRRTLELGRSAALRKDWTLAARLLAKAASEGAPARVHERITAHWAAGQHRAAATLLNRLDPTSLEHPGALRLWRDVAQSRTQIE